MSGGSGDGGNHDRDIEPLRDLGDIHVGYYTDASDWAGAEIALATVLEGLTDQVRATIIGTDVDVVAKLAAHRPGASAVVLPRPHGIRDVRAILQHRREFAGLRLDILQANLSWLPSCREALLAASTLPNLRVIAVEHLPLDYHGFRNAFIKHLNSRRLDAHVAVGEKAARIVEERARIRRGSVRVIYNGMADLGPVARRPTTESGLVLGCLARLDRVKGLDVLIEAVAPLADVRVEVAGRGPELAALEKQATDLGIETRVTFWDWIDSPHDLLSAVDVFVLPSRAEGLPLSIIEAMLAGLPVIATDVGSVRELVLPGETGTVVQPDSPTELRAAIQAYIDDPPSRLRQGDRGRAIAIERFSAERMVRSYEELYGEMLRGNEDGAAVRGRSRRSAEHPRSRTDPPATGTP